MVKAGPRLTGRLVLYTLALAVAVALTTGHSEAGSGVVAPLGLRALLPFASSSAAPPPGLPYTQMVLIGWDGVQWEHVQDMMQAGDMPHLSSIAQQGGMAPTYISDHPCGTLAGFAQILTGYPPTLTGAHGVENFRPLRRDLTVFHRLKQHFGGNITTVFMGSKVKRMGARPGQIYSLALPDIDEFDGNQARFMDESGPLSVEKVRTYAQPGTNFFIFLDFFEPDHQGHLYGENSAEYEQAIIDLDGWLGKVLDQLESNGVASTTAVCVTTDHGFIEDGRIHVDAFDAWLAANWTPLLPGDQKDVVPTILASYGIDTAQFSPRLPGRLLWNPPGPAVPILKWEGHTRFEEDALHPEVGVNGEGAYKFRVRLHDRDGDEPAWMRLVVRRDGEWWRTFNMYPDTWTTMAQRTYGFVLRDSLAPGTYSFRFRARDDDGYASGPPARWQVGPSRYPELRFAQRAVLTDGIHPNSGTAYDTRFLWKVIYSDADGDPADSVRVILWRDGKYFLSVDTVPENPSADPQEGVAYTCRRRLPPGDYDYKFEAEDKDGAAIGPPARRRSGPTVADGGSVVLTGLAALPTAKGTQITFRLSSSAEVQARVLNIAGRPVRALCRAQDCERGANTLLWNAQSDSGLPVPNGTYLVEVTAKAEDGTQARAVTPVTINARR